MIEKPVFKIALREDLKNDVRFLPRKAEELSTGYDVRSAQEDRKDIVLRAGEYFKIPLGFRAFCPAGWYYQLHPRSSSFVKKYMHALVGIIDESYPKQAYFCGQYIKDTNSLGNDLVIKFGETIAQIIPTKRVDVEILSISNQECDELYKSKKSSRDGGFGSTSSTDIEMKY